MSWWAKFLAWLKSLLSHPVAITATWGVSGKTVTGTVKGALINTSLPIVDHNPTPRIWTVSSDKISFWTTL